MSLPAIGMLETTGYTPAMVALDAMEKGAGITVLQAEINDFLGIVIKIQGSLEDVSTAIAIGEPIAEQMSGSPVTTVLSRPSIETKDVIDAPAEYNPLIQQDVVPLPRTTRTYDSTEKDDSTAKDDPVAKKTTHATRPQLALGFIETQGFTAVFEAIDNACKAANVEVLGKEKLGGGYVTVVIQGDVAAVTAAIESGKEKVGALGTLVAAHVIARPSQAVLSLLP